jgi:hypothetical protein
MKLRRRRGRGTPERVRFLAEPASREIQEWVTRAEFF